MKVNEFVDGFNKANDKEKYIKKHIINTYVPYEKKIAVARSIVDNTSHIKIDNEQKFYVNSPQKYMLFITSLFREYTDVIFGDNILSEFNALECCGAVDMLPKQIGNDYQRFKIVVDMIYEDTVQNERDLVSFIENKITAFSKMADALIDSGLLNNAGGDNNGNT